MPSANFQDYNQNNPITAAWLNGINNFVFNGLTSPCGWVRFNGVTGAIIQSYNVQSVTVNSPGNYTITYTQPANQASNCYQITTNQQGFNTVLTEAENEVTIQTANTTGVPTNASIVCLTAFGAYTPQY